MAQSAATSAGERSGSSIFSKAAGSSAAAETSSVAFESDPWPPARSNASAMRSAHAASSPFSSSSRSNPVRKVADSIRAHPHDPVKPCHALRSVLSFSAAPRSSAR
ncbi:hypothetical protein DEI91_01930 [Curtobacterium sp. MCBD17_032]|nr:hypothetical protein DEI91_01930 [Curtobacterium sp. MCBD17_032]